MQGIKPFPVNRYPAEKNHANDFPNLVSQIYKKMPIGTASFNLSDINLSALFDQVKHNLYLFITAADKGDKKTYEILAYLCMYSHHMAKNAGIHSVPYIKHIQLFKSFEAISSHPHVYVISPTACFFCSTFYDQGLATTKSIETALNYLRKTIESSIHPNYAQHKATQTLGQYYKRTEDLSELAKEHFNFAKRLKTMLDTLEGNL